MYERTFAAVSSLAAAATVRDLFAYTRNHIFPAIVIDDPRRSACNAIIFFFFFFDLPEASTHSQPDTRVEPRFDSEPRIIAIMMNMKFHCVDFVRLYVRNGIETRLKSDVTVKFNLFGPISHDSLRFQY